MVRLLRYANLKAHGVVNNRTHLRRLQQNHGFPLGKLVSPNIRTWTEDEVDVWYASRPTERKPMTVAALRGRKADGTTSAA
jgi:hypothetical protein